MPWLYPAACLGNSSVLSTRFCVNYMTWLEVLPRSTGRRALRPAEVNPRLLFRLPTMARPVDRARVSFSQGEDLTT